jgi:glycosyltransferase involved in cell wall biosynthesis
MPKVLIVSPRFPPTNAADLHRVRVSLPHYRTYGWEVTVLCIEAATADGVYDEALGRSLPDDIRVVRVKAWSERRCRRLGFGHFNWRCLLPLYRAGKRLLRAESYDVVFFSTTVFTTFVLGRLWKRKFGCRVVYDFQDPWYGESGVYTRRTAPGGWVKYRVNRALSGYLERFALRAADHIVSVSETYGAMLRRRYRWLRPQQFTVLPFGGTEADYEFVRRNKIASPILAQRPVGVRWISVGAIVPAMMPILSALFRQLAELREAAPGFAKKLRVDFVGTNYSPAERTFKMVEPIARQYGVDDMVAETSERQPYFEALSLYEASDAVLLIGSIHGDYTASKLIPAVLSKKPILAMFHRDSLVSSIVADFPNVFLAEFADVDEEPDFGGRLAIGIEWLRNAEFDDGSIDRCLAPWSAAELTRRQAEIFDAVYAGASG